jgi:hypothetical protein
MKTIRPCNAAIWWKRTPRTYPDQGLASLITNMFVRNVSVYPWSLSGLFSVAWPFVPCLFEKQYHYTLPISQRREARGDERQTLEGDSFAIGEDIDLYAQQHMGRGLH